MLKHLQNITALANSVLIARDFSLLSECEQLTVLAIVNCHFPDYFYLDDIRYITNAENITQINFSSSSNVRIKKELPLNWSDFRKLQILNLSNCGLTADELKLIIVSFKNLVEKGLGNGLLTGKQLILNGTNAVVNMSDVDTNSAITYLVSKGFTVLKN